MIINYRVLGIFLWESSSNNLVENMYLPGRLQGSWGTTRVYSFDGMFTVLRFVALGVQLFCFEVKLNSFDDRVHLYASSVTEWKGNVGILKYLSNNFVNVKFWYSQFLCSRNVSTKSSKIYGSTVWGDRTTLIRRNSKWRWRKC